MEETASDGEGVVFGKGVVVGREVTPDELGVVEAKRMLVPFGINTIFRGERGLVGPLETDAPCWGKSEVGLMGSFCTKEENCNVSIYLDWRTWDTPFYYIQDLDAVCQCSILGWTIAGLYWVSSCADVEVVTAANILKMHKSAGDRFMHKLC